MSKQNVSISDQYELNPVVILALSGITFVLGLAALVTAGSPLGTKLGFLMTLSVLVTGCLSGAPRLKLWRRIN